MLNIKIILLLLFVLFLSCSEKSNLIFNPDNSFFNSSFNFKGTNETLDIITWNIENYPKHELTNNYINEIIDSLNVDIIALQEIEDNVSFNDLITSLNGWSGYRASSASYDMNLAYLYKTSEISMINFNEIFSNDAWSFPRSPLVLEFIYKNQEFIIINNHFKCCSGDDEESRRLSASNLLYNYINANLEHKKVIVLGDFNDLLNDNEINIFENFLDDNQNYSFTDYNIAISSDQYWSFPSWPSHLDHILITNELFNDEISTNTIMIDYSLNGGLSTYDYYISDHRPVGIKLFFNP